MVLQRLNAKQVSEEKRYKIRGFDADHRARQLRFYISQRFADNNAEGIHLGHMLVFPARCLKCPSSSLVFNLFCSLTFRRNFSSTLYPQSCWSIIQVIHSL
jgi:hypothetical protein